MSARVDQKTLDRLSLLMRELGGTDADSIIALSMACLRAVPRLRPCLRLPRFGPLARSRGFLIWLVRGGA